MSESASLCIFGHYGRTPRVYRYVLEHTWDDDHDGTTGFALDDGGNWPVRQRMVFVMLNPSTADERQLDPTLRRCRGFAQREGFAGMIVLNLFALRSTDPRALAEHLDPVGPRNDALISRVADLAKLWSAPVVYGWGAHPQTGATFDDSGRARWAVVDGLVREAGLSPLCLGTTSSGAPRHPLYLRGTTPLSPWEAPE